MEVVTIVLLVILIGLWIASGYFGGHKKYSTMSFRESLDLVDVPIVTFYEGDSKLNFLLDTGSTCSYISSEASKILKQSPVKTGISSTVTAIGKSLEEVQTIEAMLKYKDNLYPQDLIVSKNLDQSFKEMRKDYGVQLHGILGSNFFNTYNYVLDFKDMIAYVRK